MIRYTENQVDLSRASFSADYPESLIKILLARGLETDADLDQRLSTLADPGLFKGMEQATALLEQAIRNNEAILVCGDYDVDGATGTALMIRVLRLYGARQLDYLVPNRFDFGYGLSPELVRYAAENQPVKPSLIITVDNGISSLTGVAEAQSLGIRVLVTDHHLPGSELPDANALINPNQPDCGFPSGNLAGVGVVFYLLIALRAKLRGSGWFVEASIAEPRLEDFLDLVALGTTADLVPLDRLNRTLVAQGLKRIRSGVGNAGIRALFDVSGRAIEHASSADLGFALGPRINAAGRLDDIRHGIECLLSDDPAQARQLALELHEINQDRRLIQEQMIGEAERALAAFSAADADAELPWGYSCFEEDWHQGIVGLVASRLKEQLHRPVIAFAPADLTAPTGELKGSGRSVTGLHLRDCLERISTSHPGLIKKFGGHAMAAGLSIDQTNYALFANAFDQCVRSMVDASVLDAVIPVDGRLSDLELNEGFASLLENLLPWGQTVPEPKFVNEFEVVDYRWLKETHLKLRLASEQSSNVFDGIWFNAAVDVVESRGQRIEALYSLGINRYMGRESLQLMVHQAESI